jgi:hypothetical protein
MPGVQHDREFFRRNITAKADSSAGQCAASSFNVITRAILDQEDARVVHEADRSTR